jgi:hypothetical protein
LFRFSFSVALLVLAGFNAVGDDAQKDDLGGRLISRLRWGTIKAHLHKSLLSNYGVGTNHVGLDDYGYTTDAYTIGLSEFEEWPTVMGYATRLLAKPMYSDLIQLCEEVRQQSPDRFQPVERIILQAELWTAFDSLYIKGIEPKELSRLDIYSWQVLLWNFAQTMRHVAMSRDEIATLALGEQLRKRAIENTATTNLVELYWVDRTFIHEEAVDFRRTVHLFYFDPAHDLAQLSHDDIEALLSHRQNLSAGSVALLEEDAIALASDLHPMATQVPLILKTYHIPEWHSLDSTLLPEFRIFRINRKAPGLEEFPKESESWAMTDLPYIPGYDDHVAYRAPVAEVCAGCHAKYPQGFEIGFTERNAEDARLTRLPQNFSANRNIDMKLQSAEWRALRFFWDAKDFSGRPVSVGAQSAARALSPSVPPTLSPSVRRALSKWLGIGTAGLLACSFWAIMAVSRRRN